MAQLVTCDTCPAFLMDSKLRTITTSKGPMRVCKDCFDKNKAIETESKQEPSSTSNQIPEEFPKARQESPEVNSYLQAISPISNPQSVPHPDKPTEKFTLSDLFAEFLRDEQVRIANIFDKSKPGYNDGVAYKELEDRIERIESVVFEGKTRASELHKKLRELDAASGKNRWDKERRGEQKNNLSDPRSSPLLSAAQKQKKKDLSKVETIVKGMLDIGNTAEEIIDMLSSSGKFKGAEIREAVQKFSE